MFRLYFYFFQWHPPFVKISKIPSPKSSNHVDHTKEEGDCNSSYIARCMLCKNPKSKTTLTLIHISTHRRGEGMRGSESKSMGLEQAYRASF